MAKHTIHVPHELFWEPLPDITPYELAVCLPLFTQQGRQHQYYDQLPSEAKRHWNAG
jgi:hypothetical protein